MNDSVTTPSGGSPKPGEPTSPVAIGLDLGYSYLKVLTDRGDQLIWPTAVAPMDLDGLAAGWTTAAASPFQPGEKVTMPDGATYLVGQPAIWSGRRFSDHLRWDEWWHSLPYQVLLRALRSHVPVGAVVVTGLPLHLASNGLTAPIQQLIKQILKAKQVLVTAQGVAAALAMGILEQPDAVAVVDIGGRTTELVAIVNGRIQLARSAGVKIGVQTVYDSVAARLRRTWAWEDLDGFQVEQAIRGDRTFPHLRGAATAELAALVRDATQPLADRLLLKLRDLWQDGRWFSRVVVCGGGSGLLADTVRQWRKDAELATDAQWLNAKGYLQLAARIAARQAARSHKDATAVEGPQPVPGA